MTSGFAAAVKVTGRVPVHFLLDGGLEIFFAPYKWNLGVPALAKREAALYFAWFLASDWRNSIVKCRNANCGRYYTIKNPSRLYKRGTYCRNHSSAKSAEVITTSKRDEKRNLLLQLAKDGLASWNRGTANERKKQRHKKYIAEFVNKRTPPEMKLIAPKSPITMKWVTRNLPK